MQSKQTPKWLELFITAFGAKGLVALAWWMGALHAERIRSEQHSYPFLEVTGGAGSGKSALLSVLWNLLGVDLGEHISLARSTRAGLLRKVYSAVDWPVVIEEVEQDDGREAGRFDWDELKTCYTGGAITHRQPGGSVSEVKFRGALVILGNPPLAEPLRDRFVFVRLDREQYSEESNQALKALFGLHLTSHFDFLDTVRAAGERLAEQLRSTTGYFIAELQEHTDNGLTARDALNHAQLRALLLVLDDLFGLPADVREAAHGEVNAMTWDSLPPY